MRWTAVRRDNILITGASGFVGRVLLQKIYRSGFEPVLFKGDITSENDFERMDLKNMAHCVHLAALTYVPESWKNPKSFYSVNTGGTLQILEICRRYAIPLTYVSSYMYGTPSYLPIDEKHTTAANNPYAHSKLLAESLCQFYVENFNTEAIILRPFNLYGPGQKEDFLIPQIIRQAQREDCIYVESRGPKRDYLYVGDFCEAIMKTIKKGIRFEIYNVGSGTSYSVGEIIAIVQEILGTNKPVVSKEIVRKNEIMDTAADCRKIELELGWKASVTLRQGLEKCCMWRENKNGSLYSH